MSDAIAVEGVSKRFGEVEAVSDLSFIVRRGELFGFLGPNGAGKTTTINMLTGLSRPDSGTIRICGIDRTAGQRAAQHLLGVVPDESNLYPELTGFENLCFCAALYGLGKSERQDRARELLDDFGLAGAANRKFGGYSGGMKRRLTIAAGIIHKPQILFLDEPTTGIDVAGARKLRRLIADLHQAGTTIFLTTHYIEHLIQPVQEKHLVQISCAKMPDDIFDRLSGAFPGLAFTIQGREAIRVESGEPVPAGPLVRFLEDRGAEVTEAKRIRPSLEDVFVRITGIDVDAMRNEKEKMGGSR